MQLTETIFQNSALFVEKKWVENRLWGKSAFLWGKRIDSSLLSPLSSAVTGHAPARARVPHANKARADVYARADKARGKPEWWSSPIASCAHRLLVTQWAGRAE